MTIATAPLLYIPYFHASIVQAVPTSTLQDSPGSLIQIVPVPGVALWVYVVSVPSVPPGQHIAVCAKQVPVMVDKFPAVF